MSTGSELLRRLRKQQEVHQVQLHKGAAAGVVTAAERDSRQQKSPTAITKTTIEVCLGPDCSGSGGGAALLEIEDLVSHRSESNPVFEKKFTIKENVVVIVIVPGGCRDFCTMGPNVHVRVRSIAGVNDGHYSKVNGPEACRAVVDSIYGEEEESASVSAATASTTTALTGDTSSASTMTILRRREDGIRWRAHRKRAAMERRLRVRER